MTKSSKRDQLLKASETLLRKERKAINDALPRKEAQVIAQARKQLHAGAVAMKSSQSPVTNVVGASLSASGATLRNLSAKIPSGGNSLAASLMLPTVFPARRLASQYTSAPSAVSSPFSVEQSDWSAVPPSLTSSVLRQGQTVYGVCRNPLCAYFQYFPNPTAVLYTYNAMFYNQNGMGTGDLTTQPVYIRDNANEVDLQPTVFVGSGSATFFPHGDYYYPVDAAGRKGIFLSGTTAFPVNVSVYVASGALVTDPRLLVYTWNGDGWTRLSAVAFAPGGAVGGVATFAATTCGYFAFSVCCSANAVCTVQMIFSSNGSVIGFRPLPGIDPLLNSIEAIRVSAAALMVTPHPSTLYEGGQICGIQLPSGVDPFGALLGRDPFTEWSGSANARTMVLKKGMYAFMKPTDVRDFDLQNPARVIEEELFNVVNPMYPTGGWLVMATSVGAVSGSYPAGIAHITRCYGAEFRTTNIWFQQMGPQLTPKDWDLALEIVRVAEQFHENPLHFKDIVNFIGRAGKSALRLAPTVLKLLGPLFPQKDVVAAAALLLQHAGSLL